MKVLFKNKTKYNKLVYKQFLEFHQKVYGFRYTLYTIYIATLLLFIAICQISFNGIILAIISFVALIIFLLWRLLHPVSTISKEIKSNKIQNEESFTFYFYDKLFKIREENKLDIFTISYFNIHKVFETKTFFYIYIDKTHSFLISKSNFTIGTSDKFSKFIKKKCWYKYKLIKDKNIKIKNKEIKNIK